MKNSEAQKILAKAAADLGEHFDCVQIFANTHRPGDSDNTVSLCQGVGNWYSRYGQVREWLVYSDERERMAARSGSPEV